MKFSNNLHSLNAVLQERWNRTCTYCMKLIKHCKQDIAFFLSKLHETIYVHQCVPVKTFFPDKWDYINTYDCAYRLYLQSENSEKKQTVLCLAANATQRPRIVQETPNLLLTYGCVVAVGGSRYIWLVFRISLYCQRYAIWRPTRLQIRLHRQQSGVGGTRAGTGSAGWTDRRRRYGRHGNRVLNWCGQHQADWSVASSLENIFLQELVERMNTCHHFAWSACLYISFTGVRESRLRWRLFCVHASAHFCYHLFAWPLLTRDISRRNSERLCRGCRR